ncbi:hypothetical protein OS493_019709 [Desmophyllum pertusum]|uniref:Cell growth-regulating nucleolar protein-like winged helix domain-containing protein n=1 Tax=Desmophyllum pertusum TaxID=174260 RepID=A0A9W9YZJ8_9CNID|nr:hypothetical protein OS493_019709 [Desmophyllum pertusum]
MAYTWAAIVAAISFLLYYSKLPWFLFPILLFGAFLASGGKSFPRVFFRTVVRDLRFIYLGFTIHGQNSEKLLASAVSICRLKGSVECQTGGLITVCEELQSLLRLAFSDLPHQSKVLKVEIEETAQGNNDQFNWKTTIKTVLRQAPDQELPIKRLRKKVLAEFEARGANNKNLTDNELRALFEQKVTKNPKFKVHKDRVKLIK